MDECKNIYSHYQTLYPILKNVELIFKEQLVVNGTEIAGATLFEEKIPTKIKITTYVCKNMPRQQNEMVLILLHEMAHAINYQDKDFRNHQPPTYAKNSKYSKNDQKNHISQNKLDRKRNKYRNYIDSHHPPSFWEKCVEITKIAVEKDFVKIKKKPELIDVNFVKKISMGC